MEYFEDSNPPTNKEIGYKMPFLDGHYLTVAFQANHPMPSHNGIVDDTGRQIETIAGVQGETIAGLGQAEGNVAPDHINHLVKSMAVCRVNVPWAV